ncbi:MAG: beta-eliminating lyase-related protein [Hyphomicrobiales bacterium]
MMFASDNWAGACPQVQRALADLGPEIAPAYGGDALCAAVDAKLSDIFEAPVESLMVATGSAANALALAHFAKPGGITLAHTNAHVMVDEYNGPERVSPGLKILGLEGPGGKLTADGLSNVLSRFPEGVSRQGRLTCLSLTQAAELGQAYTQQEVSHLASLAKQIGMGVHMDGARFANAIAHLACSPADMTWRAGVDCLSLGFTKNGAWAADLLIFFNGQSSVEAGYIRKQMGQNFSKPRFMAAQILAMLDDDIWLNNARHANRKAADLASGLAASGKTSVPFMPQANEVFAYFDTADIERLQKAGASFYPWPDEDIPDDLQDGDKTLMRLVCSFATSSQEVERFLNELD